MTPQAFVADSNARDRVSAAFGTTGWWLVVVERWNHSEYRNELGELGHVRLHVTDVEDRPTAIFWDDDGYARIEPGEGDAAPLFHATEKNWRRFVAGEFTAAAGLLQGDIGFEGEITPLVRYSIAFNRLAETARTCTT